MATTLTAAQNAKYEAEYLSEKQACDDFNISKELFLYTCKTRDGLDADYPGETSEPTLSEADGIYQSDEDVNRIRELGARTGETCLAIALIARHMTFEEARPHFNLARA